MKTGKFLLLILAILVILALILSVLPGTGTILRIVGHDSVVVFGFVAKLVVAIVFLVVILGGPWFLGYLGKSQGVQLLDGLVDEHVELTVVHRVILGILTSLVAGALGIGVVVLFTNPMAGWNWINGLFRLLGWSGVWEVPPVLAGVYWFIGCIWAWAVTDHES